MNRIISRALKTEAGRRVEIQVLMNLVTSSMNLPGRMLLCMPSARSLDTFAVFTAEHLAQCTNEQRQTLHEKSLRLGTRLRRCLSRRDSESVTELIFLLYSNIGISMQGLFPGKVTVRRCHFCRYYPPEICSVASLMDAGVICGLMGGGSLKFHERKTEGSADCLCELT